MDPRLGACGTDEYHIACTSAPPFRKQFYFTPLSDVTLSSSGGTDKDSTALSERAIVDVAADVADDKSTDLELPQLVKDEAPPKKKRKVSNVTTVTPSEEEDRMLALKLAREFQNAPPATRSRSRRSVEAKPQPKAKQPKSAKRSGGSKKVIKKGGKRVAKPVVTNDAKKVVSKPPPAPKKATTKRPRPKKRSRLTPALISPMDEASTGVESKNHANIELEDDGECARTRLLNLLSQKRKRHGKPISSRTNNNSECVMTDREKRKKSRDYRRIITLNGMQHSEALKENELKNRKKPTFVAHSKIHGKGLFADHDIEEEGFVMEFIGEVVRPVVADLRERRYQQNGTGSSYLFQLDANRILDATTKGSSGRYINHSCNPNVVARSQEVNGQTRIIFFAKKAIARGQEITYDYNFVTDENKKEQCRCGSSNCRGFI